MAPNRAGYQPLNQDADPEADVAGDLGQARVLPLPVSTPRKSGRSKNIDLKKLDTAWTESIAQKVKGKKKAQQDNSKKEILRSVFEPEVPPGPPRTAIPKTLDHNPPMTHADYEVIIQSIRAAINEGIHPKMIMKGSSGSYFARAKSEGRVQTVAVFKPKDEEPYGRLNPKTTKWLHRQFRWLIPFGRACLIPNLSYISEAAASLLDQRLELNIVPRTELVSFSSPAFFYDWIDRTSAKKGKPLPEKIGSLQYFLHGYQDATDFLRKHPWPGRAITDTFDDSTHRKKTIAKRLFTTLKVICGSTGDEELYEDDDVDEAGLMYDTSSETMTEGRPFYWSQALQANFREELEKLVILDYLMLNTDRGSDNYMIKYCEAAHEKSLVDVAPTRSQMPNMSELKFGDTGMASTSRAATPTPASTSASAQTSYLRQPHIHIAAIDNSLSFPHEHPQGWRSFTYGWLYLPVSIIGRPFSEKTRNHFLPLLTSKAWWEETTFELRKLFALDPDFHPKMFKRQLAVIKGQAFNIVQSLRHHDEGPLELTRRTRMLVWDDEVEVEDELMTDLPAEPEEEDGPTTAPMTASPRASIRTLPIIPPSYRTRSRSFGGGRGEDLFPPPVRRRSTDLQRPVPFAGKFTHTNPGLTGVTVLEHMERLDAVEAGLKRLGVGGKDGTIDEEDEEEVDVGESSSQPLLVPAAQEETPADLEGVPQAVPMGASFSDQSPFADPNSQHGVVDMEASFIAPSVADSETDLAAMSKSMSHMDPRPIRPGHNHFRWSSAHQDRESRPSLDWMPSPSDDGRKRMAIVERAEAVSTKPLLSCW